MWSCSERQRSASARSVVRLTPGSEAPQCEQGKEKQDRQRQPESEFGGEAVCDGVRNRGQQEGGQQSNARAQQVPLGLRVDVLSVR
jgi:hypothetical protein